MTLAKFHWIKCPIGKDGIPRCAYYGRGLAYDGRGIEHYNWDDYDHAIQETLAYEARGETYLFQSNLAAAISDFENASGGHAHHSRQEREAIAMKRILNLALLAVAGFISASGVLAQTIAIAKIPFNFNLQERRLPQGMYQVIQHSSGFIELRGEDGKVYAGSVALPSDRVGGAEGKLVFHRYGDQYFLSEVQTRTTDGALKVPICKAKKQARKRKTSLRQHAQRSML